MRIPDAIAVRCLAGDEPFPGSWLSLTLEGTEKKSRSALSFALGPARDDGRLLVRREDVLAQARYLEQAVGLDYGRLERRWSGKGWLAVAGADELRHQFVLTFGETPLRLPGAYRAAAARALRFLFEHDGVRFSVSIESEPTEGIELEPTPTQPVDWLPEALHEPVLELLSKLARRELPDLVKAGALTRKKAKALERKIIDAGVMPVPPPDIALLLASAELEIETVAGPGPEAETESVRVWSIEAPLWTRDEGPGELKVQIRAREPESGLTLELIGVVLSGQKPKSA
jgi:hypothetical protein